MKNIILDGDMKYLPDDIYAKIALIVGSYRVCQKCGASFEEEHYEIASNFCAVCLKTLLEEDGRFTFSFLDCYKARERADVVETAIYRSDGYILIARSDNPFWRYNGADEQRDIEKTLSYWGYYLPALIDADGNALVIKESRATIYGDLPTSSAIILLYKNEENNPDHTFQYLLYRRGGYLEIPVKWEKGSIHKLFLRAKREAEKYKDDGEYLLPGDICEKTLSQNGIFALMAFLESERFKNYPIPLEGTRY